MYSKDRHQNNRAKDTTGFFGPVIIIPILCYASISTEAIPYICFR